MKASKIFKRPDGSLVEIDVCLWIDGWSDKHEYRIMVTHCEPRKRNFLYIHTTDDFQWRKLDSAAKKQYELKKYLEYATLEEIQEVKMMVWEKLKPTTVEPTTVTANATSPNI